MMSEYLKILTFPSKQVKTSASRICYEIMSTSCSYYLSSTFHQQTLPGFYPADHHHCFSTELESEKASDFPTVIWQSLIWDLV